MLSASGLLVQLVAPQSPAESLISDYSVGNGTERGREAAMDAEEEGRLLAEDTAEQSELPPHYVPDFAAQDQRARLQLRRQNSSIVELAADAHGQTGLSAALATAALTRQPAQLSRQLSQTLQGRTNPETQGFV